MPDPNDHDEAIAASKFGDPAKDEQAAVPLVASTGAESPRTTPTGSPEPTAACEHGFPPGHCPEEDCLYRREVKNALLGLAGSMAAASDQARAMSDAELGELLLSGRWSTIEVHEAGRRLSRAIGPQVRPQERADSA